MTNGEALPPASRGTLRDEAADWFAVMRGPDADARQTEFQQWLGESALHREAYNRIAETFSLGKALKAPAATDPPGDTAQPNGQNGRQRTGAKALVAAALILAGLWAGWSFLTPNALVEGPSTLIADAGGANPDAPASLQVRTEVGEIRQFHLADGSVATLDTDSLVLVSFGEKTRALTLIKGRARFDVAHEARPFLVSAGRGTIKAVGTIFDVALLGSGRVDVRLLRGSVDVDVKADAAHSADVRRLTPGKVLSFGAGAPELSNLAGSADANWPKGLRDFDGVTLGSVLADANRYAKVPLRAASPDISDIRISGTFRVDNGAVLASNIADVLGLARVTAPDQVVLMRECPPPPQENCRPPS